jgi:hypothetical protein
MKYRSLLGAVLCLLFVLPGPGPAAAAEPNGAAETAAPRGAFARITGYTSGQGRVFGPKQRVIITRIDHEKVHGPRLFSFESNPQDLSPGRHIISVEIQVTTSTATGRLWLDAEAGKSYIVRRHIEGYGVRFWIEETDTGRVVGGVEPGDD